MFEWGLRHNEEDGFKAEDFGDSREEFQMERNDSSGTTKTTDLFVLEPVEKRLAQRTVRDP